MRRESIWTPVTSSAHGAASSLPGQSAATSSSENGITSWPPRVSSGLRGRLRGHRKGLFGHGTAAPARGPCPRSARRRRRPRPRSRARSPRAGPGRSRARRRRPADDLVDDRARVLAARVVGGDDRDVGEVARDPAHHRPLLAVAVAAAAEDADDAPGVELARGREHVLERVGRVRVVDDDRERLPLVDGLEATGDAVERLEPAGDRARARCRGAGRSPSRRERSRR